MLTRLSLFVRPALLIVVLITISACSRLERAEPSLAAQIAPGIWLPLPDWYNPMNASECVQQISGEHDGHRFTLVVRIAMERYRLRMVALDALGRRAYSLSWQGQKIDFEHADWARKVGPPQNIAADFLIAFWPVADLRPQLYQAGLDLRENGPARQIWKGDQLLITIEESSGGKTGCDKQLRYHNKLLGYQLSIQSVGLASS